MQFDHGCLYFITKNAHHELERLLGPTVHDAILAGVTHLLIQPVYLQVIPKVFFSKVGIEPLIS